MVKQAAGVVLRFEQGFAAEEVAGLALAAKNLFLSRTNTSIQNYFYPVFISWLHSPPHTSCST